jgi:hypothetical protein
MPFPDDHNANNPEIGTTAALLVNTSAMILRTKSCKFNGTNPRIACLSIRYVKNSNKKI